MSEFVYLESELAKVLGVSRTALREFRTAALGEGVDYGTVKHKGRRYVAYGYSAAAKAVREIGGVKDADEVALALAAADLTPKPNTTGAPAERGVPGRVGKTEPMKLLEGPWEVPAAELVVEHLTRNDKILMASLSEEWIREHGYKFFHKMGFDPCKKMRVRVKTSVNFIPKMTLECRWIQQDLWECTQRMPRWRGKY